MTFCNRQPIAIGRGEGCVVWYENGNESLDFTSARFVEKVCSVHSSWIAMRC